MASPGTQPVPPPSNTTLAERADVHKSCKGVEALLGIFNEYCEAISAVNALQRQLAKALRDTATMRVTSDVAVNAMNTSAIIFETLADVDTKFTKIADKEYDMVSTEVKKWFKKLAKEERNHDDKMSNANAKIKQAGQNYEKKSKKKGIDASEEHVRYVNLISTLGPEMAQEKYNHALGVTQRHSSTLQSVAACLARLADCEWQKSCECVRRFSPTIGSLGQWKALCEGGWTGAIPSDLPEIETGSSLKDEDTLKVAQEEKVSGRSAQHTPETRELELPRFNPPGYSTGPPSASASAQDLHHENAHLRDPSPHNAPEQQAQQRSFPVVDSPSPAAAHRAEMIQPALVPALAHVDPNTGSVRSLSAFPSPPTHFPIPPNRQMQQSSLSQTVTLPSNLQFPSSATVAESPVSAHSDLDTSFRTADQNLRDSNSSHSPSIQATAPTGHSRASKDDQENRYGSTSIPSSAAPISDVRRPIPVKSYTSLPIENLEQPRTHFSHRPSSSADLTSLRHHKSRHDNESREFGIIEARRDGGKAKSMDPKSPRSLERSDTVTSTGGLVAAMRNRYSYTSGSTSPPPREPPHIPTSVNNLASRYEIGEPLSPRLRAVSPASRQQSLPAIDTGLRNPKDIQSERAALLDQKAKEQELQARERELDRRAKENELIARKQDLEMRTLELEIERERMRLHSLQSGVGPSNSGSSSSNNAADAFAAMRPRERRTSLRHQLQRPPSRVGLRDSGSIPQGKVYGGSAQLTPPPPLSPVKPLASPTRSQKQYPLPSPLQEKNPMYSSGTDTSTGHASNCGCESCSVSKYASAGIPQDHQHRRVTSKPDKPKSWMRRLSMPVGNALGLDSAKRNSGQNQIGGGAVGGATNFSLGAGVGNTPVGGRGLFLFDGKKNASTTALGARVADNNGDGRISSGQLRTGGLPPGKKNHDARVSNNGR